MATRDETPDRTDRDGVVDARTADERPVVVDRDGTTDRPVVAERLNTTDSQPVADPDRGQHVDPDAPVVSDRAVREEVVAREKERFGGMKFGTAFFGWLTAAGTAAILTALVSAIGAGLGMALVDAGDELDGGEATSLGLAGIIVIALIIFVAYLAGGYVAGRMARFSGAKQGVAVWLWSIAIAIIAAVAGLIAGTQFDVLARLGLPRLPVTAEDLTVVGIITALVALAIALLGAVLGGMLGMRFHRRVDRVGLEPGRTVDSRG